MSTIRYDAEFAAATAHYRTAHPQPVFNTVFELRAFVEPILQISFRIQPFPSEVLQETFTVRSGHDGAAISVTRLYLAGHGASGSFSDSTRRNPATLHIHGGGFVCCDVAIFLPQVARLVRDTGVQAFAVDYRRAPEHAFPAAVEDCYAALAALTTDPAVAERYGVDRGRVLVFGDSAGGGLAAGMALLARDRGLAAGGVVGATAAETSQRRAIHSLVLVYPMLDDRTTKRVRADDPARQLTTWSANDNQLAWDAYLGGAGKAGSDVPGVVSPYAAAARATSYKGLPPVYVDVGGLDVFRDEIIEFVARLYKDDVEVEFHLYPGVPHGWEGSGDIWVVRRALENRVRAVRAVLREGAAEEKNTPVAVNGLEKEDKAKASL